LFRLVSTACVLWPWRLQVVLSSGLVDVLFCNLEEAEGLLQGLPLPAPPTSQPQEGGHCAAPASSQQPGSAWSAASAAAALAQLSPIVVRGPALP
jgi:hypothetical protein